MLGSPLTPLVITRGQLQTRAKTFEADLTKLLGLTTGSIQISLQFGGEEAVSALYGSATERVQTRNRGSGCQVLKIGSIGTVCQAWIGLREVWQLDKGRGGQPTFAFESIGLTIYAGDEGNANKPQILRSEWAGYTDRGSGLSFQARGAGHPHWQVDAFETLDNRSDHPKRQFGEKIVAKEFGASSDKDEIRERIAKLRLERFHLASAACWWLPAREGSLHHQHAPGSHDEISRWALRSIEYIREQFAGW